MFQRIADRINRKEESGFTLVELLMVIVILGILAAVVVFSISSIKDKGQNAACKADYNSLITAEEANYANPDPTIGGKWVSEATLAATPNPLIAQQSKYYDITLQGTAPNYTGYTIVPASGSSCTAPPS